MNGSTCPVCRGPVKTTKHGGLAKQYCSLSCRGKAARKRQRQTDIKNNLCVRCGVVPPRPHRRACGKCAKKSQQRELQPKIKERRRHLRRLRRKAVFTHYGGRCACCGEKNPFFLTLDHINNDGGEKRKVLGNRTTWTEAVKLRYPSYLQVLCWNCNLGKFYNGGACPHRIESPGVLIRGSG